MQPTTPRGGMDIHPGTRLGPYEILAPLGAGAMGQVYRARDTRLDRFVAIKVLAPSPSIDPRRLERLQREARAIARVSHPNICALYDVGQQDDLTFLVMEHLEGETLARTLERGSVPLGRVLVVGFQIADALDAAHRHGVIHRDLKPGNIMLTADGVKLLDFGLAKMRETEGERPDAASTKSLGLTEEGAILGTYPYMAPEQVEGRSADARSDIFALGVVVYEMATGRRAFEAGSRASLAAAILTHDPAPVSTYCAAAPPLVDRVVARCLAKDPDARWQTARDLASELRWISERGLDRPDRETRHAGRQPHGRGGRLARAAAVPLGIALVAAIALWGLAARGAFGGKAPIPRFTQVTFRSGTVGAARFAPDGQTIVYSAAWQAQPHALFMSRTGSAESRDLGITNASLLGVSSSGDLTFLRGSHLVLRLGVNLGGLGGTLERVSLAGGAPRAILEGVRSADWIPGTTDLAVARDDGQVEFPIGTKLYKPPRSSAIRALRVSPRGDRVALLESALNRGEMSVVVVDRAGKKTTLSTGWTVGVSGLAWSPDANEVWFSALRQDEGPVLWAVSMSGKTRVLLATPAVPHIIEDVFRDGRILLTIHDRRIGVSCLPPGEETPRELGWLDSSAPAALSADGRTIVFADRPRGPEGRPTCERRTALTQFVWARALRKTFRPTAGWCWSNSGRGAMRLSILPTGPGSARPLPPGPFDAIAGANFLPDGRRIAFAARETGHDARIYVQDLQGGPPRAISPEGVWTNALATPDGRFVWGRTIGLGGVWWARLSRTCSTPSTEARRAHFHSRPLASRCNGVRTAVSSTCTGAAPGRPSWTALRSRLGARQEWKTMFPIDPVGIDRVGRALITPDGKHYCLDYVRLLSRLYIVDGVQ